MSQPRTEPGGGAASRARSDERGVPSVRRRGATPPGAADPPSAATRRGCDMRSGPRLRMRLLDSVWLLLIAAPAFAQEKCTLDEGVRRASARSRTTLIADRRIRRAEAMRTKVCASA